MPDDMAVPVIMLMLVIVSLFVRTKFVRVIVPILVATVATLLFQTRSTVDFIVLMVLPFTLSVGFALIIPRQPLVAYAYSIVAVALISSFMPSDLRSMAGPVVVFMLTFAISIFSCGLASWLWRAMVGIRNIQLCNRHKKPTKQ